MIATAHRGAQAAGVPGVVVLAAGLGSRLGAHTRSRPKALVEVQGQPLLHWVLSIARSQLRDVPVVVVVGHLGDQVVRFLGSHGWRRSGVAVARVEPIDTAVSLFAGLGQLERRNPLVETVISVNADTLVVPPMSSLLQFHETRRSHCTVAVTRREDAQHPRWLGFDDDCLLTRCAGAARTGETRGEFTTGRAHDADSSGVIVWSVEAVSRLRHLTSIEQGLVPSLVRQGRAYAYDIGMGPCIDCGTPTGLAAARAIDWRGLLAASGCDAR